MESKEKPIYEALTAIPGMYEIPLPLEGILFSVGATFSCSAAIQVHQLFATLQLPANSYPLRTTLQSLPWNILVVAMGLTVTSVGHRVRLVTGQGEVTKGYCELLGKGKNYN